MPKFRVHFEASAAVGIEVEVEAEDEVQAEKIAQKEFTNDVLEEITEETVNTASETFLEAYCQERGGPTIKRVVVALDDEGFEHVDTFEPDRVQRKADANGGAEEATKFVNYYRCYRCGHEWEDVWDCAVDDDCPACGARHCSPSRSEDAA